MPDAPMAAPAARTASPRARDLVALAIICAGAAFFRATSFIPAVVDTDEGLFMVQAREWLAGGWPLVAAWDMHPVGVPALFAVAFALFGVSVEAARLLGLLAVAATGCALFAAVRAAGAPRAVGVGAGLVYAAQSVLLGGLCTTTELLIAPFVAGAMAIGIRGTARALAAEPAAPGFGAVAAMGLLIGCGLLAKQVVVPEGCLAFALLVLPALLRRLLPLGRAAAMAALYALLCAAPFLLMGLAYWMQGWLADYIDGSLLAPWRYALERIPSGEAVRRILAAATLLGFAFAAAAVALAAWRPRDAAKPASLLTALVALWFAVASAAIAGPGFYFAHYFLLWLPPLSILAALGCWRLALPLARPGWPRGVFSGLVGAIAASAWLTEIHHRLERGPGWPHRDPVREVAAELRRAAGPGGAAFIANYHPSVYVIAGVRAATRFPFPPHLTGVFEDLSDTNTREELARVLASRPRAIVVDRGWMHSMRPEAAAAVMEAVARDYELFASVAEFRGPVEVFRVRETARPSAP